MHQFLYFPPSSRFREFNVHTRPVVIIAMNKININGLNITIHVPALQLLRNAFMTPSAIDYDVISRT